MRRRCQRQRRLRCRVPFKQQSILQRYNNTQWSTHLRCVRVCACVCMFVPVGHHLGRRCLLQLELLQPPSANVDVNVNVDCDCGPVAQSYYNGFISSYTHTQREGEEERERGEICDFILCVLETFCALLVCAFLFFFNFYLFLLSLYSSTSSLLLSLSPLPPSSISFALSAASFCSLMIRGR